MAIDVQTDLARMLMRLKLTAVRDQLDTLLDEAARSEMTLRDALAFLCQREIARKDQRRIDMSFGLAKFPVRAGPGRLRLRRPTLDRQGAHPRPRQGQFFGSPRGPDPNVAGHHDISGNLIRIWVEKYEAGAFDGDVHAADLIQAHEARDRRVRAAGW